MAMDGWAAGWRDWMARARWAGTFEEELERGGSSAQGPRGHLSSEGQVGEGSYIIFVVGHVVGRGWGYREAGGCGEEMEIGSWRMGKDQQC